MKKPYEDLFDLIHTLNSQEIKHFRTRLRSMDSLNSTLFEALLQMESYDESSLRTHTLPGISDNVFSVAKYYLYHSLLSFLLSRDHQENAAWKIRTRLEYVQILYRKDLYEQARRLLKNVERAARQLDDPSLMREILLWRFRLYGREHHVVREEEFDAACAEWEENMQQLDSLSAQELLHHQFMYRLRSHGILRDIQQIEQDFGDFFNHPRLQENARPENLAAQLRYDYTLGNYAFMRRDMVHAGEAYTRIITAMENTPGWKVLDPELYVGALYRMAVVHYRSFNAAAVEEIHHKIEQQIAQNGYQAAQLFFYKTQTAIWLGFMSGDLVALNQKTRVWEDELPRHADRLSTGEYFTALFNNATIAFMNEDFELARKRLHTLLNHSSSQMHKGYNLIARILLVLIYEHERDSQLFQYYRRSVNRLLQAHRDEFPAEHLLMEMIGSIFNAKTPAEICQAWEAFFHRLEAETRQHTRSINYFDFRLWAQSRALGIPFTEHYRNLIGARQPQS